MREYLTIGPGIWKNIWFDSFCDIHFNGLTQKSRNQIFWKNSSFTFSICNGADLRVVIFLDREMICNLRPQNLLEKSSLHFLQE